MKNMLTPLAKSVLIQIGLTTAAATTDAAIQRNIHGLGITTLIISNKEIDDITKIVKYLQESGLPIKDFSKIIKNEADEQK